MASEKVKKIMVVKEKRKVNWTLLLWFSLFLGWVGVDRFLLGQIGIGVLKLLTFGGLGVWWFIDLVMIMCSYEFKGIKWKFPKNQTNKTANIIVVIIILLLFFSPIYLGDNDAKKNTTVKSKEIINGTIEIKKVEVKLGNLYPIRVEIVNTGTVTLKPKFDYKVKLDGTQVCSGSSRLSDFGSIAINQKKVDEITFLGCMFTKDGDYKLTIDMLDSSFNIIDSETKGFSVNYWGKIIPNF